MNSYFQTGLGILVSIILFFVGYRQTVGAKKERIKSANKEIEMILIRRIVNEKYILSLADIKRLLEGKARDFKVKVEELFNEEQILNSIFTRIIETDLITQVQRSEILSKLITLIEEVNKFPESIENESIKYKGTSLNTQKYVVSIMALLASVIGALVPAFTLLENNHFKVNFNLLLITTLTSLLAIIFISILKNFKDSQQEVAISVHSQRAENAIKFEKEVARFLTSRCSVVSPSSKIGKFDFLVISKGEKIIIEVKAWTIVPPIFKHITEKLSKEAIKEGATESIIVTKNKIAFSKDLLPKNVKIMTLKELKKYI